MTYSQTFHTGAPGQLPGLAPIAHALSKLVAFFGDGPRAKRPSPPPAELSRSKAFRQVQRKKWLGVPFGD